MDFKLRGKTYPITNSSDTLLMKLQGAVQNSFADEEDDSKAAYVITRACPSIPEEIVFYKSKNEFHLSLDSTEIASFVLSLNVAILERLKTSEGNQPQIQAKIREIKSQLSVFDNGVTAEQVKLLTGGNIVDVQNNNEYDGSEDEIIQLKLRLSQLESSRFS